MGETKFGEHVQLLSNFNTIYDEMLKLDVTHVLFGISEDIGVFANNGKSGTSTAWEVAIKILLNTQSNAYTTPNKLLILGHIFPKKALKKVSKWDSSNKKDIKKARKLVEDIDAEVAQLVYKIVKAGKIPIIIGGGHNNSYGNIKGTSLALNKPINTVNFDAHTDFRPEEGRHSGNGFTLKTIKKLNKKVKYNTFESIKIRKEASFQEELEKSLKFVSDKPFGIEVDCDAIENMPSSAMTPPYL